ncbi:MAG: DNA translocase FtsK [Acutalibacteraceae bacterium]|jgi:S-DNA-T family DNA segregation ATPase FtsK/SpoIIIE|nr:DNA translocase FtsK [Clostridiales bacterium]
MANTTKKKPSSSKKNKGSANKSKNTPNGKMYIQKEQQLRAKRQIWAVVIFASAIFNLSVCLIPGGNAWATLRSVLFGVLGVCAFILPLILFYVSIMAAMDKPTDNIGIKVGEAFFLTSLFCAAIFIFSSTSSPPSYFDSISQAYKTGLSSKNGGAVGAIIGGAILKLFPEKITASITIVLLIFVTLMIMTGTTLINLYNAFKTPVQKAGEFTGDYIEKTAKEIEERRARFNPDVNLGPTSSDVQNDEPKEHKRNKKSKIDIELDEELKNESEVQEVPDDSLEDTKPILLDDIIKKAANTSEQAKVLNTPDEKSSDDSFKSEIIENHNNQNYNMPPIDCLAPPKASSGENFSAELKQNAEKLVDALKSFGVETKIVDISRGPTVTRYELSPAAGVKISRITGLADDIALNLAASGVRIEAPIPNKAAVGIEVPNKIKSMVTLRELLEEPKYKSAKSKLNVALGRDIAGQMMCADLAKMPHILIAGTTGSGKSVCLNSMILSILYNATPDEVKLVMIDPKQVEFTVYNGIPHLLSPVVSDPRKASGALGWAVKEMLDRYKTFSENNVRDISGYNESIKDKPDTPKMPQIVIFIDELSDLMMAAPNEVEDSICRLAQMARAAGIHLVIATQRPSVDVITGIIKANIPSRIALSVSSQVDSRTILDMAGAEKLLGNGDMLYYPVGTSKPIRIQGCYTSDKEVETVINYIKEQEQCEYDEDVVEEIERQAAATGGKKGSALASDDGDDSDELLPKAIEVVVEAGQASTTLLQRKLKVGYARAARMVDELEGRGIIGEFEGSKPRKVLITKQQWLEMNAMSSNTAQEKDENEEQEQSNE